MNRGTPTALELVNACRKSPLAFAKLLDPQTKAPKHLKLLSAYLKRVEKGEIKRLIINMPPRHGKSHLTSKYFPSWFLGKNPNKSIICATYAQELSNDFGRSVRDILCRSETSMVFPDCRVRDDNRAMSALSTTLNGNYIAVGVGGSITGRGADVLLIDDPIKGRQEADSEAIQSALRHWYSAVARTRLHPNGAIIVVQTRWHIDDLCGYLLKEHAHEGWVVIDLPAMSGDGPLWPERYDMAELLSIKQALGLYEWNCLYQQQPTLAEGMLVKPHWIDHAVTGDVLQTFIAVDPAISQKTKSDETAISVVGMTNHGNIRELETIHGHWDVNQQVSFIRELSTKYKPMGIGVESTAFQRVLATLLNNYGMVATELSADVDKVRRFFSISHLLAQGRAEITSHDLREQLLMFRGETERNDMVDAFVYATRMALPYLEQVHRAHLRAITPKEPIDPWQKRINDGFKAEAKRVAIDADEQILDEEFELDEVETIF